MRLPWLAAIGCGAAATAGHWLFPQLAFARNPTGQYHPAMLLFAGLVGCGLGAGQVLAFALARALSAGRLVLWLPFTVPGVIALILPLWWTDAEVLVLAPWFAVIVLAPGLVLTGALQALLVRPLCPRWRWFVGTLLGGAAGAVGGLFLAVTMALLVPIEGGWAAGVAIGMALGQLRAMAPPRPRLTLPPRPNKPPA